MPGLSQVSPRMVAAVLGDIGTHHTSLGGPSLASTSLPLAALTQFDSSLR